MARILLEGEAHSFQCSTASVFFDEFSTCKNFQKLSTLSIVFDLAYKHTIIGNYQQVCLCGFGHIFGNNRTRKNHTCQDSAIKVTLQISFNLCFSRSTLFFNGCSHLQPSFCFSELIKKRRCYICHPHRKILCLPPILFNARRNEFFDLGIAKIRQPFIFLLFECIFTVRVAAPCATYFFRFVPQLLSFLNFCVQCADPFRLTHKPLVQGRVARKHFKRLHLCLCNRKCGPGVELLHLINVAIIHHSKHLNPSTMH